MLFYKTKNVVQLNNTFCSVCAIRSPIGCMSKYILITIFQKKCGGEAHFQLSRYVYEQSCRIWALDAFSKSPCLVWLLVWRNYWTFFFFFENDAGNAVTVNGTVNERYRTIITDLLWPEQDDINMDDMCFQLDDANAARALLHEKFLERIISRNRDVIWSPRSCDLIPFDFFLWAYLKNTATN